jgi:hypothetical protein
MAAKTDTRFRTMLAAVDLTAKRYYLVKQDGSGNAVLASAATDKIEGSIDDPGNGTVLGAISIAKANGKVILGGTVAPGDQLTSDANAKAIATTTGGNYVFGRAVYAGVAGDIIEWEEPIAIKF